MLIVKIFEINPGCKSHYYGLKEAAENSVLYNAPNNWKTKKGAYKWAVKNGMKVID